MAGNFIKSAVSKLRGFLGLIRLDEETYRLLDYHNLRSGKVISLVVMVLEIYAFVNSFFYPVDGRIQDKITWLMLHRAAYIILFIAALQTFIVSIVSEKVTFTHGQVAFSHIFFMTVATAFGILISAYDYMLKEQILVFITMEMTVACIFVMRPYIAFILETLGFIIFHKVMSNISGVSPATNVNYPILWILIMTVQHVRYTMFLRLTRSTIVNERLNKELTTLSYSDPLTGIKNRHALREDFKNYINKPVVIMYCDIDDFKKANDTLGHRHGDEILKTFARELSGQFSSRNCYRMGGDEFLIILSETSEATFLAKETYLRKYTKNLLSYSAGYVTGNAIDDENLRSYIDQADKNLYLAKKQGKGHLFGVNN